MIHLIFRPEHRTVGDSETVGGPIEISIIIERIIIILFYFNAKHSSSLIPSFTLRGARWRCGAHAAVQPASVKLENSAGTEFFQHRTESSRRGAQPTARC